MNIEKSKVLVSDGNSRQILPILHGLHQLNCNATSICTSRLDNGFASRYSSKTLFFTQEENEEKYQELLNEIQTGEYDVLIPLSDSMMDLVTRHENELSKYVRLPIPTRDVFLRAYDKQQTMTVCMEKNIPCPITKLDNESLDSFIAKIGFPIVAKPRMACGSMGLKIIHSREELDNLILKGEIHLNSYVIQEYIPQTGKQINVHLFMDDQQSLASGLVTEKVRWYPVSGGASCFCMTISNDDILKDCERLLQAISWRSYCEIELIVDPRDNKAKVMEINGRASASIKIMDLAGINVASQMMQLAYGEPVTKQNATKKDVRMRRTLTDILWFLQSPDRFSRRPSWINPYHTHDVTFSWHDPLPSIVSIIKAIRDSFHYRSEMNRRQR